ncbi:MAG: LCP family protein [Spirochaetes bacterium]|nr:LCP family protein [Spirochaetota bacterium]
MAQLYSKSKSNLIGFILIGIIIFIIIFTIFLGIFFKSEEKIKVLFKNGDVLSVLVAGIDNEKNINGAFVFFYQTSTNKCLSINILPKTLIKFKDNHFTLEESLNKKVSYDQITKGVAELIGQDIKYYLFFDKNNLIKFIDMMEGVQIYTKKIKYPDLNVNIPEGFIVLDGDKTIEYLSFLISNDQEAEYDQLKRIQNYIRGFLKINKSFFEQLNKQIIVNYFYKAMITNFDPTELLIIYEELQTKLKKNISDYSYNLKTIIIYCDKKYIENNRFVYLPKKSGEWIKSETNDVLEFLESQKEEKVSNDKIVIEILNGTDIVGLASRSKNYLLSFGVEVLNVGNANTDDYENTVVIIHGSESKGKKIAELIKCERIVIDEETDNKIDATIILGRDFDGKIVR